VGYSLLQIEGIGDVYIEKLRSIGIRSTDTLLEQCKTPKGRKDLAQMAGISPKLILEWANLADLMRIKGIGEEWADLLEEAGVDTVNELKERNANSLYDKIIEVNDEKRLVRRLPPENFVKDWIKQAKKLKPALEY
jgi:predicted flap endonuclease-1-like 5' DNA nuclease